ncbi:peptidase M48 [Fulvitalea axinellae]|uniref:Peptidase M48 n=1 Tax=Fulvitalea axinellae TaxID=1182444 RepID=A0AAU9CIS8_9BACT|nr:peptidase M48 [Fulvitalea axinellae]
MRRILFLVSFLGLLGASCSSSGVLLFSLQDDVKLGRQVRDELLNDSKVDVLDRESYPEAYAYLDQMVNEILNSGNVKYRNEFEWEVRIIRDDVLNAFCAPGGYIFVYTGLIDYLDKPDDLAGVLGHEIAHADLRHTSRNLQQAYGVEFLLNLLIGENPGQIEQIAAGLAGNVTNLAFSRSHERESDDKSVEYLSGTRYKCDGASSFFAKMINDGQTPGIPEFLSTHPNPDNRVESISKKALEKGCDTKYTDENGYDYEQFKMDLRL